jgi:multiple sugar transport system permease protein
VATAVPVSRPLVRREVPWEVRRRRLLVSVADHAVLIGLTIAFLGPFVFIVGTSLMTDHQALSTNLWPQPAKLSNYTQVFKDAPLFTYARNTFMYAGLATLGMLISSVPVAYALAACAGAGATSCSGWCSCR